MQSDRIPTDLQVGDIFASDYRILGELGSGGMGSVLKAEEINIGRKVAIKIVRPQLLVDKPALARFRREASAISKLDHPGIVKAFRVGITESGQPFTVMEYIEGKSLSDLLARNGRLPLPLVQNIFGQILDAVGHAHANGILHRDLKPSNVMLIPEGESYTAKIVDFGLAYVLDEQEQQKLTQTGHVVGTAAYLSPEQCRGERADARSDLYAVGCMLYEALVGRQPFVGDSPIATMLLHEHGRTPEFPSDIDKHLKAIILRAFARERADRFQTAEEFKKALSDPHRFKSRAIPRLRLSKYLRPKVMLLTLVSALTAVAGVLAFSYWKAPELSTADNSDVNDTLRKRALEEIRAGQNTLFQDSNYDQSKFADAHKRYQAAMDIAKDDPLIFGEAHHGFGMIAREEGKKEEAKNEFLTGITAFEKSNLKNSKFYAFTAFDLGELLYVKFHYTSLAKNYLIAAGEAVEKCNDAEDVVALSADLDKKIAHVLEDDPHLSANYYERAAKLFSSDRRKKAMRETWDCWNKCGIMRRNDKDYPGAAVAFEQTIQAAQRLNNRYAEACANQDAALPYFQMHEDQKGRDHLQRAIDLYASTSADYYASACSELAQHVSDAKEQERLFKLGVNPPPGPSNPGDVWRQALARVDYAGSLLAQRRFGETEKLLKQAIDMTSSVTPQTQSYAPYARARAFNTYGLLMFQQGRDDEALQWFQKAEFMHDINSAEAKHGAAEVFAKRGQNAKAVALLNDAARDAKAIGMDSFADECTKLASQLLNSKSAK